MKKRSSPDIAHTLSRQERSGLSVAEFARREGIPSWKLYQARRAVRSQPTEFLEVEVLPEPSSRESLEIVTGSVPRTV